MTTTKPVLHSHFVPSPFDHRRMAVQITHQRVDGLFIIGYVEFVDATGERCFAYTLDGYKLLCDPDTAEPALFHTVVGAGEALTTPEAYHLRPGAYASIR